MRLQVALLVMVMLLVDGRLNEEEELVLSPYKFKDWRRKPDRPAYMVIGIPTVFRPESPEYLEATLSSLATHAGDEIKDIIIVIYLGDTEEKNRNAARWKACANIGELCNDGTIVFVESATELMPKSTKIVNVYKDEEIRVRWRQKQCLDFAFLINAAAPLAKYYLQLEDDVLTVPFYFKYIKEYIEIADKSQPLWPLLEFSSLGFIAKLFKQNDALQFAELVAKYWKEQPVDFLLSHWLSLRGLTGVNVMSKRIIRKPSIFQHIGSQSSLIGKTQDIMDLDFDSSNNDRKLSNTKQYIGDNPPAVVSTTIKAYESEIDSIYSLFPGFFWGMSVNGDDVIVVSFLQPQFIRKVIAVTGKENEPNVDILEEADLEVSFDHDLNHWRKIAAFSHGKVNYEIDSKHAFSKRPVYGLRVFVNKGQASWIAFQELAVWVFK